MPADSEPTGRPVLPKTYRPLGPRIVAVVLVVGLLVVCVTAWFAFPQSTRDAFTLFQRITMAIITLMILACVHALTRSRVTAEQDRLVVVNGYRRRDLAWAQIVAVRMPPGAPWARLDLADGSEISAMGIQGSDGAMAKDAVRELRRLLAQLS
ncbi:PH domain-containing protein [Nocardioides terrae]|uniref:PH domain-containing protein n=1 Tax=Nocardioides terrae TaxID=574651 RepID=A0A1I1M2B1_9ACTN|nr:PH domain-containing protein [Nocardioides terrae]SFC79365.1 PH domain-containing protein [Nocardioides terrae]